MCDPALMERISGSLRPVLVFVRYRVQAFMKA
jgi:hypothetical protein